MEALAQSTAPGAVRACHCPVSERVDNALVVVLTVWSLALKVLAIVLQAGSFDATDPAPFQNGMMFTVIIALEFRRTLVVITERQQSIVHVRAGVTSDCDAGNRAQADHS